MKRSKSSADANQVSEAEKTFVLGALKLVHNEATRYALTLQFEQACKAAAWLEQASQRRTGERRR